MQIIQTQTSNNLLLVWSFILLLWCNYWWAWLSGKVTKSACMEHEWYRTVTSPVCSFWDWSGNWLDLCRRWFFRLFSKHYLILNVNYKKGDSSQETMIMGDGNPNSNTHKEFWWRAEVRAWTRMYWSFIVLNDWNLPSVQGECCIFCWEKFCFLPRWEKISPNMTVWKVGLLCLSPVKHQHGLRA